MKKVLLIILMSLIISIIPMQIYAENNQEPSDWAVEIINDIKEMGVIDNSLLKNFTSNMKRSEFAYLSVVLYQELTGKECTVGRADFTDTKDSFILKAKNHNLVSGYPDGSFKPNNEMTRAEISKLFINVLKAANKSIDVKLTKTFKDDYQIPNWAKESVYIAKSFNIVNGVGENIFDPNGKASREQALAMFYRIYQKYLVAGEAVKLKYQLKIGDSAPGFNLKNVEGKEYSLYSLRGKPVILFFSTTYDAAIEDMFKIYKDRKNSKSNEFVILNINISSQDKKENVKALVEKLDLNYPILLDEDGYVVEDYSVSSRPYTFVIDSNGIIKDMVLGYYNSDKIDNFAKLLK